MLAVNSASPLTLVKVASEVLVEMSSPAESHASDNADKDVHVIDIEYDVDTNVDTINKPYDVATLNIQIGEITADPVTLKNENGKYPVF